MNDIDIQQEMFAVPIGLKIRVRFDGQPLYGSNRLNNSFLKALSKVSITKGSINSIENMLKQNIIIPCFFEKGLRSFISWKVFAPSSQKLTVGFYCPANKVVVIALDNNTNIFSYANNNWLATLTIHELIHLIADQKSSQFLNIFRNDLIQFYKSLWIRIFSLKDSIPDNEIKNHVEWISRRLVKNLSNSNFKIYHKRLEDLISKYTTLKEKEWSKILYDYIIIQKIYVVNERQFYSRVTNYKHIIYPIYDTYKKIFNGQNLTTMCIQELFSPSEVIAIYSEINQSNSNIQRALKLIA